MSEEEKQAVENLKKDFIIMNNGEIYKSDDYILYNLIEKQQKEIDKKDKVNKNHETMLDKRYVEMYFISKDKIKDKIKWYKDALENYECEGIEDIYRAILEELEDLLKEN